MPTATIGSPQTIALGAADALIVSCSAVDAVASVAGSTGFIGAPYELGRVVGETGKKFGPYGRSVSVIVSALAGSITAEVSQPSRVGDGADALSAQQGAAAQGVVSGDWTAATSGAWRTAALGAVPRFFASGGASGGTWALSTRNAVGAVVTEAAETVAAGAVDVSPVYLDDASEIMVTVTGTVTVEVK